MPAPEHRRERLLRRGAASLSDAELVANLLRTGDKNRSALRLAQDLLAKTGGLRALLTNNSWLINLQGIGPAKEATLLTALEVARRLARAEIEDRILLDQPAAVAGYISVKYVRPDQEILGVIFVDARNRLLADSEIFRGTIQRTAVEPRAILKEALDHSATGIIMFHSHPSGDPSPGIEDCRFTRRVAEAGEIIGIKLLDHVIVGFGGQWVSMQRQGAW